MSSSKSVFLFGFLMLCCTARQSVAWPHSVKPDSLVFRPEVERMFDDGLKRFGAREYEGAAELFGMIARQYPSSHRASAAFVMGAKALFRLGDYQESIRYLDALQERFPESSYLDEAHFVLGLDYHRLGRFSDAVWAFLDAIQRSSHKKLRDRAESILEFVALSKLNVNQLRSLREKAKSEEIRLRLTVIVAEKTATSGDLQEALRILRPIAALSNDLSAVRKAKSLLRRLEQSGELKIGLLLPLMEGSAQPGTAEIGKDLLEGIRLAAERHNSEHLPKVNLVVRDTERDPSVSARQTTDLSEQNDLTAILGPVFSNQVFASAGIANARGIPMITPTATSNGIAAIGPYIFQANPDYAVRGRAMAQFAVRNLHASRLAVVAPVDAVGKLMADSFIDEARLLGVELMDPQWYESGATDLRTQLSSLREQALKLVEPVVVNFIAKMKNVDLIKFSQWGVPQKVLDSLVERTASVPVELLFGKDGRRIADSLKIPSVRMPLKYDSLGIPVQNIDAIFLPIASPDEIGIVASQLKYFNFQTQLLGTGDWQDLAELDRNRQYADGVIFSTDYYPDTDGEEYRQFALEYQKFAQKPPSREAVLGYDAMGLLLNVIRAGAATRDEIANQLSSVRDYAGLHSRVSFSDARVNSSLILLQFKKRSFMWLGEIDVAHQPPPE